MLRRAPTSISLSHRDVREHLEHINLQKLRERENIQPGQGRRLAPVQGGCVPMTLSREHLDSNEKNNVTVYESDKTNQQRGSQGNVTFASYPPDGAEGRAHGDSLLSGAKADLIATEKLPASVICNNSEVDDNIIPADLSDSLEHLEEPRVLRHEDSSVQPQTSKPRTDYGGLAEGFSGQSSLLGQLVKKFCEIFTTCSTSSPYSVTGTCTNSLASPTGYVYTSQLRDVRRSQSALQSSFTSITSLPIPRSQFAGRTTNS